ncbi:La domain-containing protein, partial [Rhodocollybia butyracea]
MPRNWEGAYGYDAYAGAYGRNWDSNGYASGYPGYNVYEHGYGYGSGYPYENGLENEFPAHSSASSGGVNSPEPTQPQHSHLGLNSFDQLPSATLLPNPPVPTPISRLPYSLDSTTYYLLGQLEYYLSSQNMAQDFFLRSKMDENGWLPISLLASFPRVRQLT